MGSDNSLRPGARVLMLIENLPFPLDRRMRQEAFTLVRAGYQVTVICPKGENQDRAGFEIVEGVRVYRYRLPWQGTSAWTYFLEYAWAMLCTALLSVWVAMRHGVDIVHAANP